MPGLITPSSAHHAGNNWQQMGSTWRKWDLHVHSPASIVHQYKNGSQDPWPQYFEELRKLPKEIEVLGINDYWFLDGYKRVRTEFEKGSFPNLLNVFPMVEIRVDTYGSQSDAKWKAVNVHFLLDPDQAPELYEDNLIKQLRPRVYTFGNGGGDVFSEAITPESLARLGKRIREQAVREAKPVSGSDQKIGFDNLRVNFDESLSLIQNNSALLGRVLVGVGLGEWDSMRWDSAPTAKKKIVNRANFLLTASPDADKYVRSSEYLKDNQINTPLLHSSDAHTWLEGKAHNGLGSGLQWLNCDPTFSGIKHALAEFGTRGSVGIRPGLLDRLARAPRETIRSVQIRPSDTDKPTDVYFDQEIPLNPSFVAIIGNKGQGKSALLDAIALAGNSPRHESFSFLTESRFRKPPLNLAGKHNVSLTWEDSSVGQSWSMDSSFDQAEESRIEYLPQSLLETICMASTGSNDHSRFIGEIERVAFGHIPYGESGEASNLSEHVAISSTEAQEAIRGGRERVRLRAAEYSELLLRLDELRAMNIGTRLAQSRTGYQTIEAKLQIVQKDLNLANPESKLIATERERIFKLGTELVDAWVVQDSVLKTHFAYFEKLEFLVTELEDIYAGAIETNASFNILFGIENIPIVKLDVDLKQIEEFLRTAQESFDNSAYDVQSADLQSKVDHLMRQIKMHKDRVDSIEGVRAEELQAKKDLTEQLQSMKGDRKTQDSIVWLEMLVDELTNLPAKIELAHADMLDASKEIHRGLALRKLAQSNSLSHVQKVIDEDELASGQQMNFETKFTVQKFFDRWSNMVNRQKLSEFIDLDDDRAEQREFSSVSLEDADEIMGYIGKVVDRLGTERGSTNGSARSLQSILRKGQKLNDLLSELYALEWLASTYQLNSAGMELSEMSPGQRGLTLLLFYLLIDASTAPLLLDQPEENLDNQTIKDVLVPALKVSAARRQIIAVTHNPNFAVVGDADQIIRASREGQRFVYSFGSLSQAESVDSAISVLEGTRPAFANRTQKYSLI